MSAIISGPVCALFRHTLKRLEEKYKEHDPLKYADTVAKVIRKGSKRTGTLHKAKVGDS